MLISQRWPKAFIISSAFHLVLICALGFASTSLFSTPPVIEQIIELDLTQGQSAASAPAAAAPLSSATAPTPLPTPSPMTVTEAAPVPAVPSDDALLFQLPAAVRPPTVSAAVSALVSRHRVSYPRPSRSIPLQPVRMDSRAPLF